MFHPLSISEWNDDASRRAGEAVLKEHYRKLFIPQTERDLVDQLRAGLQLGRGYPNDVPFQFPVSPGYVLLENGILLAQIHDPDHEELLREVNAIKVNWREFVPVARKYRNDNFGEFGLEEHHVQYRIERPTRQGLDVWRLDKDNALNFMGGIVYYDTEQFHGNGERLCP